MRRRQARITRPPPTPADHTPGWKVDPSASMAAARPIRAGARWRMPGASTTGSTTSQASPIDATHSYAAPGSNTVRVTVTDKDGAAGSGTLTVTVSSQVVTLVGAGNIARCDRTNDEATAAILDSILNTTPGSFVFALGDNAVPRSEEHTSELQSLAYLVCRLLLEKKKKQN